MLPANAVNNNEVNTVFTLSSIKSNHRMDCNTMTNAMEIKATEGSQADNR